MEIRTFDSVFFFNQPHERLSQTSSSFNFKFKFNFDDLKFRNKIDLLLAQSWNIYIKRKDPKGLLLHSL